MPETNDAESNPFDFVKTKGYDSEFFLCFKDPLVCIATFFCPCCMVGKIKGELDGRPFDLLSCCCAHIATFRNRRYVQERYNITENGDASMCATACCAPCAICQDGHQVLNWSRTRKSNTSTQSNAPAPVTAPASS